MLRSILGILLGLVAAVVVVAVVETINVLLFPLPEGVDPNDPAALAKLIAAAPAYKLALVPLGWLVAALVGGWVAAKLARRAPYVHAFIIGGFLAAAGILTMVMIPHPMWFWAIGPPAPLVGAALAARLAPPRTPEPTTAPVRA